MSVNILFFASAKDVVGTASLMMEADGWTIEMLLKELQRQFPRFEQLNDRFLIAVNQEYADMNHVLKDGDEVAVIPPVSVRELLFSHSFHREDNSLDNFQNQRLLVHVLFRRNHFYAS
jgi:molybdopterin synthase sulfur carrier subunit